MPDVAWWLVHGVQSVVLVAAMALALAPARRLGGHTLYGNLLFVMALGFWALLLGEALYLGRKALGVWQGPGSLNDAPSMVGWLLLWLSILLFVERFSPGGRSVWKRRVELALFMAVPAVIFAIAFRWWLSPPGADPDAGIRFAYLMIDAVTIGVLAGGIDRFRRLRKAALGRLYLLLGIAASIKTAGDFLWAYLAAHGGASLLATALYPTAGLIAVAGLGIHARATAKEHRMERDAPWRLPQQQFLGNLASRLHDLAGGYPARTALVAAGQSLGRDGIAWRLDGWTVEALADEAAWQRALAAADDVAVQLLGAAGREVVAALAPERGRP